MPQIFPYKAVVYSQKFRSEISKLLSPPYDVISPEGFSKLKKLHPYQSVQLALVENSEDPARYSKMKALYQNWKAEGVLESNPSKAFYLVEDSFLSDGKYAKRVGFIALLQVSPFEKKEILPHEHTLSGPKKDRLELLKTMRAEVSQIFLCYKDPDLTLEEIYDAKSTTIPMIEGTDTSGIHRRLWALSESQEIEALQRLLSDRPALIADGHHRYETALAFSSDSKFAQVYFTNLSSPGFSIHPIHRIFSLPDSQDDEKFLGDLRKRFTLEEWTKDISVAELMTEKTSGDLKLFCCLRNSGKKFLLTQKARSKTDAEIFSIHRDIFEEILGWNVKELAKGTIHYEHETKDFFDRIESLPKSVGLFLPPTDLEVVMNLAEKGERMPQKSTFFYPKLASGLVNFDLDTY